MSFLRRLLRAPPAPPPSPAPSVPERASDDSPRVFNIVASRSSRKSFDCLRGAPPLPNGTTDRSPATARSLDEPSRPSRLQVVQTPNKVSRSGLPSVTCPNDPVTSSPKPNLIRRVTSRLLSSKSSAPALQSRPSNRTLPLHLASSSRELRSPTPRMSLSPTRPNGFNREAALRERGLLPPRKDLSEQEREADARLRCTPVPVSPTRGGMSEAELLRASWMAENQSSHDSDAEWRPPLPPYMQGTKSRAPSLRTSSSSSIHLDVDLSRRSAEGKSDPPPVGRLSTCSSCPPFSSSSNLEVLLEEPSEQAPSSPLCPARFMITVSDSQDSPDSPVSDSFSSHCRGSTPESPVLEKENSSSRPSRRSGERSRKIVKPRSLSTMGSRSLNNLRHSIVGSLRMPSSSTLSTADVPPTPTSAHLTTAQTPRTAVSPTIHSLGSILWETKDIKDVESRRLSELAFLH